MADLAKVRAGHRPYVLAPAPARFIDRSPDPHGSDSVELKTAQVELADLVRLTGA
jgi:hypothetical protein